MSEELARALVEAKAAFRKSWATLIEQQGFSFEVAQFDTEARRRHMALWDLLIKALKTGRYDDYLAALERDGRMQARSSTRVEAIVNQMIIFMNLIWDVVSDTPATQNNPQVLKLLGDRLNQLRARATTAIITGYQDEARRVQEELARESVQARRERIERTSLQDLIKSVHAFKLNRYAKAATVFSPGDNRNDFYFIMKGRIRLYEFLPDGRAITVSILGVNDVFAQTTGVGSYFRDVYAETMSDAIVACIPEGSLSSLMEQSPLLGQRIIDSFSQQISQSQLLIEGLLGRDVAVRLVNILLKLADEFGMHNAEGQLCIDLGLTHQELADMIGSNRVTVTRKLLELQKKNLISVHNRTIHLLDKRSLEGMVA